jgi:hypothetical protein
VPSVDVLQRLASDLMFLNFTSVGTFLWDCPSLSQIEPVAPPLFDRLQYMGLCKNIFLWVCVNEPPSALNVSLLLYGGFNYENSMQNHMPHCRHRKFRPQDEKI